MHKRHRTFFGQSSAQSAPGLARVLHTLGGSGHSASRRDAAPELALLADGDGSVGALGLPDLSSVGLGGGGGQRGGFVIFGRVPGVVPVHLQVLDLLLDAVVASGVTVLGVVAVTGQGAAIPVGQELQVVIEIVQVPGMRVGKWRDGRSGRGRSHRG